MRNAAFANKAPGELARMAARDGFAKGGRHLEPEARIEMAAYGGFANAWPETLVPMAACAGFVKRKLSQKPSGGSL